MNIHILVSFLVSLWTVAQTAVGTTPEHPQDPHINKMMEGLDLRASLDDLQRQVTDTKHNDAPVNDLIEFLQANSDQMFGDVENIVKSENLSRYYSIVQSHPNNQEMIPHLFQLFEDLAPLKPKEHLNWGEMLVVAQGGPLGQTINLLAIIGGRETISQMLDHAIKAEDLPKLEEILFRLRSPEIEHETTDLLEQRIGAETPEAVNELLRKEFALREEIAR